jgi:hypothetical protein
MNVGVNSHIPVTPFLWNWLSGTAETVIVCLDAKEIMNRRHLLFCAIGFSADSCAQATPRSRLVGVWRLRSCLRTFKDGRTIHPFGEKPVGRIEYTKAGIVSALLMRPARQSTLPPGTELDNDAVTGFVAYFGTFRIEQATQTVTH